MPTPQIPLPLPDRGRPVRASTTTIDAIELLKGDHRQVEAWFAEFDAAESLARRRELAERLCRALSVHMQIEEEIFYPAFLEAVGDERLHDEAEAAHREAREVIADIRAREQSDDIGFDLQVKTLARMIERHVTDEEQTGGMFDEARQAGMDLRETGVKLEQRKVELMDSPLTDRGYDAAVYGGEARNL